MENLMIRYDFRAGYRDIKPGHEFDGYFKPAKMTDSIIIKDGTVGQTLQLMSKVAHKYKNESSKIATVLKGKDIAETCKNIWYFLHDYIQYKLDKPGQEQLRTPYRSWSERETGIDCDCFSVFVSTILLNLGINHFFRVTKYYGKTEFQHVYVVAKDGSRQYIIDCVLHQFNIEKPFTENKDYTMSLNGIDIAVLNGTGTEQQEISLFQKVLSPELSGLGKTEDVLKQHLIDTREYVKRNPWKIQNVDNPQDFIKMLDYALQYWDDPAKRAQALKNLEAAEEKFNNDNDLNGLFGEEDNLDDNPVRDEYILGELGKSKAERKAKRQEKKEKRKEKKEAKKEAKKSAPKKGFFKKIGQALKKGGNAFIRFNPVSVSARNGFLLFLKLNIKKVASNLKWAYATLEQAKAKGVSEDKWNKAKKALDKVENLYSKKLQGKKDKLKSAILKGKAGGLSGFEEEEETSIGDLGFAPAAALAAATPVIISVVKIVVDSGLMTKGETDGIEQDLNAASESSEAINAEKDLEVDEGEGDGENGESEVESGNLFVKAGKFIKNHPVPVVLGAAGLAVGGYFAFKPKKKKASLNGPGGKNVRKAAKKKVSSPQKAKVMKFK